MPADRPWCALLTYEVAASSSKGGARGVHRSISALSKIEELHHPWYVTQRPRSENQSLAWDFPERAIGADTHPRNDARWCRTAARPTGFQVEVVGATSLDQSR